MLLDYVVKILGWALTAVLWFTAPKIILSDKIKVGTKTAFAIASTEAVALAMAYFSWRIFQLGNPVVGIIGWCFSGALAIGALIGGIYGHKKGWKRAGDL